jgi:hypothetical protein
MSSSKHIKPIPKSTDAYAKLKPITDKAQTGELRPWSPDIIDLLASYKVNVQRLKDVKAQANLSFPTSIKNHRSMAIGFRYDKDDGSFAEDLFLFEENIGLTCYYRGTQEEALPEYKGTHHAKIVLSEFLPDFQRELSSIRQQIDDIKATPHIYAPIPEIALTIRAQANTNRFEVRIINNSSQAIVAENIRINSVETLLNQQFNKLFPIEQVNIPEGIFDDKFDSVTIIVGYKTLDGKQYELTQTGEQEYRIGDNRYNVIFPSPSSIRAI